MLNLTKEVEEEIEALAINAYEDMNSRERLAELMMPTMNHLLDYFKYSYPTMDESVIFYNMNSVLDYCIKNYRPEQGKFIYFWRCVVKTTMSRSISKFIVKKNHDNESLSMLEIPDPYLDMKDMIDTDINSQILMNIFEMEDEYSPSYEMKSMALLWALGCTSQEIAPLFEISPLAVRRSIKKVMVYIKSKLSAT